MPFAKTKKTVAGLLTGLLAYTPSALSQEEAVEEIEEVVVTGTRLKTTNENSSQPIVSLGEDALAKSGEFDIGEVLNDTPALLNSVTSTNSVDSSAVNIGQTQNFGGAALDLRGLGIKRTLTLVNGRRHVAGIEGTSAVDISTIPSGLIDRVDILSGGASAVYGADALTGVVNVILKDDFEGFDIGVQAGADGSGDTNANKFTITFGSNFADDRGNVVVAMQSERDKGLMMGQRAFLADQAILGEGANPDLRFQIGDIDAASTPSLAEYYNFANTGLFGWGLRIPTQATFLADYESEFGSTPTLTSAEQALFTRAANAPPRALLPGYTYNITSEFGVISAGDFGAEVPLGSEPDLDGDGVTDCLQSFTGYNSGGAIAGGCWVIRPDGTVAPYTDGLVAGSFNHFGATDSYINPNQYSAIPEKNQESFNIVGHFDVTDTTSIFWEGKYVYQKIERMARNHNFTDLLHGLPDNPYLPTELAALADNSGVGFAGIDGGLHISRDSADWGPNVSTNTRRTARIVFGVEGELSENFSYELSANYGKFNRKLLDREEMIADRFFAAIDAVTDPATGETVCRSDLDPTAYPKTTPFNIFQFVGGGTLGSFFTFTPGDGQCKPMNIWGGEGAMSQESLDFITYDRTVREKIQQQVYSGFVTGDTDGFFSLPGGPIGLVAGLEWRKEESSQTFGALDRGILPVSGVTSDGQSFSAGGWVGDLGNAKSLGRRPSTRLLSSGADYDFFDYFFEAGLPILSDVPGAYELGVDLAYRSSDNSTFGEQTTLKYGLTWAPTIDARLRYTFSEATRVPNLFELFSPEQGARFRPDDPCDVNNLTTAADVALRTANCVQDLVANNVASENLYDSQGDYAFEDPLSAGFPGATGGNPDLMPETGETTSYGIVLTPRFIEGLALSVDFVEVDIADAIMSVSSQNIVDRCYDSATLSNQFCPLISRNDDTLSAQSGGLDFLRQVQLNFGAAIYEGMDVSMNYGFTAFDTFLSTNVIWTTVTKLELIEQGGEVNDELGEMRRPENSGLFSFSAARGPMSVEVSTMYLGKQTLNYEGGTEIETVMKNFGASGFTDDDTFITDIRGAFAGDDYSIYFGVNNVTDENPYGTERAYPVSPVGRYFYVGANYSL